MASTVPTTTQTSATKGSSIAASIAALAAAPCVIYLIVLPLGLGAAIGMTAAYTFFDTYRFIFIGIAAVMLVLAHMTARRSGSVPKFLWIVTIVAVVFMATEFITDPPWERHKWVPM